jgi:hypothetical protein
VVAGVGGCRILLRLWCRLVRSVDRQIWQLPRRRSGVGLMAVVVVIPGGMLLFLSVRWSRFSGEGYRAPLVRLRWEPPWWGVLTGIAGWPAGGHLGHGADTQ